MLFCQQVFTAFNRDFVMKRFLHMALGLAVAAIPLSSAQAENINIYGWQNWSYEFIDADQGDGTSGGRPGGNNKNFDRLSNNAANIGFMSHMDTGIPGLQVGLRCEQFTYWGRNNEYTGWCNRNSKISLRHEQWGEIMFGQWLLPFNEIVAQWVDPFYDAGADSHTSIMGNIGGTPSFGELQALFYNGGFDHPTDFTSAYGAMSFNRRQEGVIQYVWPNTSDMASQSRDGFQFRFAMTEGSDTDSRHGAVTEDLDNGLVGKASSDTVDPRIFSTGASYQRNLTNGDQFWVALAYERHEDTAVTELTQDWVQYCGSSQDDAWRLAARYVHSWANGQSTMLAAMYEELDYEIKDCSDDNGGGLTREGRDLLAGVSLGYTPTNGVADGLSVERDAWMVSGKHNFGNGFDFRFSYISAEEYDCDDDFTCPESYEDETEAEAINLGLFYTMPAGTELRATYSAINNEDFAEYDFGINPAGFGDNNQGEDIAMFAVGIVHWFD